MTHRTEPANASAAPRPMFDWLFAVAVLAVAGLYVRATLFTPMEVNQGLAQKIYYVHVPSAIAGYLAISISALASVGYLWLRDARADRLAEASAEVGLVFFTAVLSTGPIWARWIWGVWWAWGDMRLTLTLFLWMILAAYLVLRGAVEDQAMRSRYSAVLAILAALLIPFIHLSVYMFRGMHPEPIVLKPSAPSLSGEMLTTFLFGMGAFSLLALAFIRVRYRYAALRDALALIDEEGSH